MQIEWGNYNVSTHIELNKLFVVEKDKGKDSNRIPC